jgi:threonine synthase
MWRYRELLPVAEPDHVVSLGEGFTPLIPLPGHGFAHLWLKDEGLNPTGTFKARGASCGISIAVELGIDRVGLATAGNAGGAWACYGAAASVKVRVAMPDDAPTVNRLECRLHGADLVLVGGLIDKAAETIARAAGEGWFDVSTLKEPYRIEGKKTLGFEIAEQLAWRPPDAMICPVGGGVGVIGMWRGFRQLQDLGWLKGEVPRLVAVQPEGCAPVAKAFQEGREEIEPWPDPRTDAQGLRIPNPLGGFLVLRAIRETGGMAVTVTEDEIARAVIELGRAGISACPEGAATLAAARRLVDSGDLRPSDRVVMVNTGNAHKDPAALVRSFRQSNPRSA